MLLCFEDEMLVRELVVGWSGKCRDGMGDGLFLRGFFFFSSSCGGTHGMLDWLRRGVFIKLFSQLALKYFRSDHPILVLLELLPHWESRKGTFFPPFWKSKFSEQDRSLLAHFFFSRTYFMTIFFFWLVES